jgi:hypothetical protein
MNVLELVTEINRVLRQTAANPRFFSREDIVSMLNDAQLEFVQRTRCVVSDVSIPVAANQATMTVPSDFLSTERVVYNDIELLPADLDKIQLVDPEFTKTTGPFPVHFVEELPLKTIRFVPIPTVAGTAVLWYVAKLPALSADSDVPAIPTFAHRFLKYGVYKRAFSREGERMDVEKAQIAGRLFDHYVELVSRLRSV